jgi:diguanylate cyclase (GGDEF)-like protein
MMSKDDSKNSTVPDLLPDQAVHQLSLQKALAASLQKTKELQESDVDRWIATTHRVVKAALGEKGAEEFLPFISRNYWQKDGEGLFADELDIQENNRHGLDMAMKVLDDCIERVHSMTSQMGPGAPGQMQRDTDVTTGIPTKKQYVADLPAAILAADKERWPLALLILDIDDFKAVNSSVGHSGGDKVLEIVAQSLSRIVKLRGSAYRYAGDEFVAILPNHSLNEAVVLADRVRSDVAALQYPNGIKVTVTIGVSAYPIPSSDASQLFNEADKHLLEGKARGEKNAVHPTLHASTSLNSTKGLDQTWRLAVTIEPPISASIPKQLMLDELIESCYSLRLNDFGRRQRYPLYKDKTNLVVDRQEGWIGAKNGDSDFGYVQYFEISTDGAVRFSFEHDYPKEMRIIQLDRILDGLTLFWPFAMRFLKKRPGSYVEKIRFDGIQGALLSIDQGILHAVNWVARENYTEAAIKLSDTPVQFLHQTIQIIASAFSPSGALSIKDLRVTYFESQWASFSPKLKEQSLEDE